ncbi:relaxase/mobilization nuclease domain-containing protein [Pseudomonas sp. MDT1-17]
MISKIKEFSRTFRERIIYEFAARQCDREKIKHVEFVGGNLISANPYYEFNEAGERRVFVDPEPIIEEFENHTSMYKGDSDKLCAHYILSLAAGEKLSSADWLVAVNQYMTDLGYDSSTKYVAVVHRDTEQEHVHIVASRVRLVERDPGSQRASIGANFQLVPDSNDRHKGISAAREIEHKYELSTPKTDGWSKELPRHTDPVKDQAHIIRGISKGVFKAPNRPRTMSQLVDRLAERGIQIRVSERNGIVQGISYRLDRQDGRWISGTTVMSTKLTWSALQRNGVSYSPHRDNVKLGVGVGIAQPDAQSVRNDGTLFRVYVKLPRQTKELKEYVRKRSNRMSFFRSDDLLSTYLGFNIGINYSFRKLKKAEVELEKERTRLSELLRQTMKLLESILRNLFSIFEVHIDYQADTSEFVRPALRLSIGVENLILADDAEEAINDQSVTQLQLVATLCKDEALAPKMNLPR